MALLMKIILMVTFYWGILNTKDPQYHDKVWDAQPNEKLVNGYTSLTGYQKMTHILTSLTGEKVLVIPERGWVCLQVYYGKLGIIGYLHYLKHFAAVFCVWLC